MPNTPCGNSSISPAIAFSTPCTRAMPSPMEMMLPTSATSTSTAKLPICSRMILEISSAFMSIFQARLQCQLRLFIFSSWRVTLPSYTVLPMRATTPPMIAGSTLVASMTVRPVSAARLRSTAFARSVAERHGRRHFRADDFR